MSVVTLSSKFRISIPKEVRETLGLKAGQRLAFLCVGKSVRLVPQLRIEDLAGIAKGANTEGYRDRGTRREDSFSKVKSSPEVVVASARALLKSRRAT